MLRVGIALALVACSAPAVHRHPDIVSVAPRRGGIVRIELRAPAPPAPADPASAWSAELTACAENPQPTVWNKAACCMLLEDCYWNPGDDACVCR